MRISIFCTLGTNGLKHDVILASHTHTHNPSPLAGSEDDGGNEPEGHAAAADRRQDHPAAGQGRGRQDQLPGVLQHCAAGEEN